MNSGLEFVIGMVIGISPVAIVFYFKLRCKHVWEHQGLQEVFDGSKYPISVHDMYTCKTCKKNKKEIK